MDFIPAHLHQQPRRELSAPEHNHVTYTVIQCMIIALGLLLSWLAVMFF